MTRLTDMGNYFTLIKMCMKASGSTIKQMERAYTLMPTGQGTTVNGKKINNMELEKSHGLMERYMRASTMMERKMEMVSSHLRMDLSIMEISK
jgi:hypothetical protein